jgi:hypothetical protein
MGLGYGFQNWSFEMPIDPTKLQIDLTKASVKELAHIQNEVLRNIAIRMAAQGGGLAAGHDSHGSSHSKNSVLARPGGTVIRKTPIK